METEIKSESECERVRVAGCILFELLSRGILASSVCKFEEFIFMCLFVVIRNIVLTSSHAIACHRCVYLYYTCLAQFTLFCFSVNIRQCVTHIILVYECVVAMKFSYYDIVIYFIIKWIWHRITERERNDDPRSQNYSKLRFVYLLNSTQFRTSMHRFLHFGICCSS